MKKNNNDLEKKLEKLEKSKFTGKAIINYCNGKPISVEEHYFKKTSCKN